LHLNVVFGENEQIIRNTKINGECLGWDWSLNLDSLVGHDFIGVLGLKNYYKI
jgi:hypothetical protein